MCDLPRVCVALSTVSRTEETEALDSSVDPGSLWLCDTELLQVRKMTDILLYGKLGAGQKSAFSECLVVFCREYDCGGI